MADIYKTGEYLMATRGTWHLEDSPWKAAQVQKMLDRCPQLRNISTICEIGCGAGGILAALQNRLLGNLSFVGYEISPDAHQLSMQFSSERLNFVLGSAFDDERKFDLVLVMDVIEHVEDPFAFLRNAKKKGEWKMYHIPLEINCSSALRDSYLTAWKTVGHLHRYSLNSAMETLRYTGHEVTDYFLTPGTLSLGKNKSLRTQIANCFRKMLPDAASSRLYGGYSLLALTR